MVKHDSPSRVIVLVALVLYSSSATAGKKKILHKQVRDLHNAALSCEAAGIDQGQVELLKNQLEVIQAKIPGFGQDRESPQYQKMFERAKCSIQGDIGEEFPDRSLIQLIAKVEKLKSACNGSERTVDVPFRTGTKIREAKIEILKAWDHSRQKNGCEAIISFGKELGRGGFHQVIHAFRYPTWKGLAKAILLHPKDKRARIYMQREAEGLAVVQKLLPLPGLVKVYAIHPTGIYMQEYDKDLFVALRGDARKGIAPVSYSYAQKLSMLQQLAVALEKIHQNDLTHNDIKLENILVGHSNVAVYSDFELATNIRDLLREKNKNSASGNQDAAAPEVGLGWLGDTDKERLENAKKADVFSQGLVAYQLFIDKEVMDLWRHDRECMKGSFDYFQKCKAGKILALMQQEKENPLHQQNPLRRLIFEALDPDYKKRVSSKDFSERLSRIIQAEVKTDEKERGAFEVPLQQVVVH